MRRRSTIMVGWLGKVLGGSFRRELEQHAQAPYPASGERRSAPSGVVPRIRPASILVIDDEPQVAQALKRVLHRHRVTVVNSGTQALAVLQLHEFDVIVSDVMMPEPAGIDVYALLMRERPDLVRKFIFVTGGVHSQEARAFLDSIPNVQLDKPVDPLALDHAIAEVLHGNEDAELCGAG